jgi:hypothetical protein
MQSNYTLLQSFNAKGQMRIVIDDEVEAVKGADARSGYGLLRNSFRPSQEIRTIRTYWRQRNDLIREVAELLMRAAVKAIETKKERIDRRLLAVLNWKPPSQRRGEARGLHKTLADSSSTT